MASWSADKAGGRIPSYGTVGPALACAVVSTSATMVDAHGRQETMISHTITFDQAVFPNLHIRDQGTWIEGGKTLSVVGVRPDGDASGRIYVVSCEEHPLL